MTSARARYRVTKGKNSPFNIFLNEDGLVVSSEGVTRCDLQFTQNGVDGAVISSSVDAGFFTLEHQATYEGVSTKAIRVDLGDAVINPGRYEVNIFVWDAESTDGRYAGTLNVEVYGTLSSPVGALPMELFGNLRHGTLTPAQITANQDDYGPGTQAWWRLSTDASRNISGIDYVADSQYRIITNVGSFNIVLLHQDTGSAAENRIITPDASDFTIQPNRTAHLVYDPISQRWRLIAST